jgi:HAD superfamily hydrolase (TIGR01490 family)
METIFSKDRVTRKSYIAFFDLDRTLTKSISGREIVRAAYRKGLLTHLDLLNAIFLSLMFRLKLKDPLRIIDDMVSWAKGIPENSIRYLCTEISREVLLPSVYKDAVAEIEFHKTQNARIVILSSALISVCQEMAKHLNIDDIICSELENKNGYLTGRPLGHICYGEEKAVRLNNYCVKNNFSSSDAWYYGDSISDLYVLKAVGNPVCVNPDKKLKRAALKRDWKILSWKD